MTPLAVPLYVVTGVLLIAGFAKLRSPSATAGSLRELNVPSPLRTARLLGAYEVVLAILAVLTGHPLAWAGVGFSYLAFTGFVWWALGDSNRVGSCGCFGREDTPATTGHLMFNAVASAIALLSVFTPVQLSSFEGSGFEAFLSIVLIAVAVVLSIAALTVLPRTLAATESSSQPTVTQFALTSTGPKE